jgi:hypothetical protein
MLGELWNTFLVLIPVFFLITLIFGAGFVIGRISVGRIGKREQ